MKNSENLNTNSLIGGPLGVNTQPLKQPNLPTTGPLILKKPDRRRFMLGSLMVAIGVVGSGDIALALNAFNNQTATDINPPTQIQVQKDNPPTTIPAKTDQVNPAGNAAPRPISR